MMTRRLFLLSVPVFFTGCSSMLNVGTLGLSRDDFYYNIDKLHLKIDMDYKFSKTKSKYLGLNKSSGVPELEHTLLWYYGINPKLTKSDLIIKRETHESMLSIDFGLNSLAEYYSFKLFGDLDLNNLKNSGFNDYLSVFNSIFIKTTQYNKFDFRNMMLILHNEKILKNEFVYEDNKLLDGFLSVNPEILEQDLYISISGRKIFIDKADFTAYYFSMYLTYFIINSNKIKEIMNVI